MTVLYGRTVSRYVDFRIQDTAGSTAAMRSIPVDSINGIGVTHADADVTAFQDAIRNVLPDKADLQITISGPFDNGPTVAAASSGSVPALSGSHTVLNGIVGGGNPLSMDIQVGIRHPWETGEPQFGITAASNSGMMVMSYTVDAQSMKYNATLRVYGTIAPAWGTAAETAYTG